MPDEVTTGTTAVPGVTDIGPVMPVTVPPPQSQMSLPPDVDPSDGKKWKDKFYGIQGRLRQVEAETGQKAGALEAQAEGLRQALAERDATIASLKAQVEQAAQLNTTVAGLQSENTQLKNQAALANRYRAAMQHPTLLQAQVEVERQGTDGQIVKETVNPLLQLIESTTLEGDALDATLRQMAAAFPAQTPSPAPASQTFNAAVPPQPPPAGDELATLRKRADELQQKLYNGEASWEEHRDVWLKIRELEAAKAK